jgi:hypothetical protein
MFCFTLDKYTEGHHIYGSRLGIVEPVFDHLCIAIGLDPCVLRGKQKINAQWLLSCMVHNMEKIIGHAGGDAHA